MSRPPIVCHAVVVDVVINNIPYVAFYYVGSGYHNGKDMVILKTMTGETISVNSTSRRGNLHDIDGNIIPIWENPKVDETYDAERRLQALIGFPSALQAVQPDSLDCRCDIEPRQPSTRQRYGPAKVDLRLSVMNEDVGNDALNRVKFRD